MRVKLSPQLIEELEPPTVRHESFCWDDSLPGFGVRVLKSGARSWIVQYRHRGRSIRKTIAPCHHLPFTLARERAREVLAQAALGRDWFADRDARIAAEQAAAKAVTIDRSLGAMIEAYLADPATKQLRTYGTVVRYLRKVWAPIHGADAETLTARDITARLEQIAVDSGAVSANRARSVLMTAYNWMLETHRLTRDGNPCTRARRWKERGRRNRAPNLEELGKIWRAAGEVAPSTFGAVVRLLILTAARKSEIALITRDEVDLERGGITLPPSRVKTGEPHWIPLSTAATRLLRDLPERRGPRLFPTISWSRCKRQLDEAAGVSDWTIHDLRRSFSSLARDHLGADGEIVERALGHLPGGGAGRYDFSARQQQRRALAEQWARLVLGEPTEDRPALRIVGGEQ
jgi:integrase